jgi:broad specificity phosphatase PhoE
MQLLLIRHAESVGNAERRLQGQGDFPLSERGNDQAEHLARRLSSVRHPAALFASPLLRTRQTAEYISAATGLEVETIGDLREYDFGEVSGLTWSEIGELYPDLVQAVRSRTPEYPSYPGEEGRPAFRERVCRAIDTLCTGQDANATVIVVTHAGPIVVACLNVLGLPYQRPAAFAVDNCSITTIEMHNGRSVVVSTNDTCHLLPN